MKLRRYIAAGILLGLASSTTLLAEQPTSEHLPATGSSADPAPLVLPGTEKDFHGFVSHDFSLDGCDVHIVEPKTPLPGRPWVWRAMFWDSFPGADIAMLDAGFYVGYIAVGNTFGCPDALKHFDVFYSTLTTQYGFSKKPALEGLSRGGLYVYRWAYVNTDKVGCIFGDAAVCDMKSWPGGKAGGSGSPDDWQKAIDAYHFASEQEMMDFKGNPVDILSPIAAAHIPIIHLCGDADSAVPENENTDVIRERYTLLGGDFVLIIKQGCDHHPHGMADPTPVVNFIIAHCAEGDAARKAARMAPARGAIITVEKGKW